MDCLREKAAAAIEKKRKTLAALKAGRLSFRDVLNDPKCEKYKVRTVLSHMKGISYAGADKIMAEIGIDVHTRLGGLRTRNVVQKEKLLKLL